MVSRLMSSLDLQIDLVSEHVGATAWNSAKANVSLKNYVGYTMRRAFYCKANVRPVPGRVLRRGDGSSAAKLVLTSSASRPWAGLFHRLQARASGEHCASVVQALLWLGC